VLVYCFQCYLKRPQRKRSQFQKNIQDLSLAKATASKAAYSPVGFMPPKYGLRRDVFQPVEKGQHVDRGAAWRMMAEPRSAKLLCRKYMSCHALCGMRWNMTMLLQCFFIQVNAHQLLASVRLIPQYLHSTGGAQWSRSFESGELVCFNRPKEASCSLQSPYPKPLVLFELIPLMIPLFSTVEHMAVFSAAVFTYSRTPALARARERTNPHTYTLNNPLLQFGLLCVGSLTSTDGDVVRSVVGRQFFCYI
jgi:hypothetical protein